MMYRQDYLLVKVGIRIGRNRWFDCVLPEEFSTDRSLAQTVFEDRSSDCTNKDKHRKKKAEVFRICFWKERKHRRSKSTAIGAREGYPESVREGMSYLVGRILNGIDGVNCCGERRCVYGEGTSCLREKGLLSGLWKEYWKVEEFTEYNAYRWVRPLLAETKPMDYVLIGRAACIPRVLDNCAKKMKSLTWLFEGDYQEGDNAIQELIEDFYDDYGLLINLQNIQRKGKAAWREDMAGRTVCVLDFSEQDDMTALTLGENSIWIDFTSSEGKKLKLERRIIGLQYVSLKQYWTDCKRKECIFQNSSTGGNGY